MTTAPKARAHWHDAYDAQMALWRWYRTPGAMRWLRGLYETQVDPLARYLRGADPEHAKGFRAMMAKLYDAETGRLLDCDPLYVSEEMTEVVDAARQTFEPEPLLETDLLTPRGFLWFAKPVILADRTGAPLALQAASWGREYAATNEDALVAYDRLFSEEAFRRSERIRPEEMQALIDEGVIHAAGISVTLYAEREHYLNMISEDLRDRIPPWAEEATRSVPVVPFHLTPWHFNSAMQGEEEDVMGEATGVREWWALLQTTLRLMQQRIATKHLLRPHRAQRREAAKGGRPEEAEVVVVRLRRESSDEIYYESGEEANYSHRFIVSGHWRNQPYPSEGITRQIWISPYVKGPEDKPLIVRPRRVYQWER